MNTNVVILEMKVPMARERKYSLKELEGRGKPRSNRDNNGMEWNGMEEELEE